MYLSCAAVRAIVCCLLLHNLLLRDADASINRSAVVGRYPLSTNVSDATQLDTRDVFTLGNGDFAVNVDATGLQTLNASFATTGPSLDLNTLSSWGFHCIPAEDDGTQAGATAALATFNWTVVQTATSANGTRPIPLAVDTNETNRGYAGWLMTNPHRVGLGQLSLALVRPNSVLGSDPSAPQPEMITSLVSNLDTWAGAFSSSFVLALPQATATFCGNSGEGGSVALWCAEANATIANILFASYGAPLSACPDPIANKTCSAPNSTSVVEGLCLGQNACVIPSGDTFWGDPCRWVTKKLVVQANCSSGGGFAEGTTGSGTDAAAPSSTTTDFAVSVQTTVHPDVDLVATRLSCTPLSLAPCPTALRLAFPYATGQWGASANDWNPMHTDAYTTAVLSSGAGAITLLRTMDDFSSVVRCAWNDSAWSMVRTGAHAFALSPPGGGGAVPVAVELSCLFAPPDAVYPLSESGSAYLAAKADATRALLNGSAPLPLYGAAAAAAAAMWGAYWTGGAFVDLAGATGDPNATELERRVVLSKYLTRANSAGMTPPQETGLLSNSWSGKFHLEMRWWHQAHFPLWGHADLLDRSHAFYFELLENATSLATQQGYRGARWSKMLGLANRANSSTAIDVPWLGEATGWSPPVPGANAGRLLLWESANTINPVLTWNQPPVIWLADAVRRSVNASEGAAAALATVQRLAPLVFATADMCASQPFFNETSGFYEIGSPTLGAEEFGTFLKIRKPVFETVYFAYALDVANEWRELLGLPRDAQYDAVAAGLGGLPLDPAQALPTYAFNAEAACCYVAPDACPPGRFGGLDQCASLSGHPSPSGVLGLYDGRRFGDKYGVDAAIANATVAVIAANWSWSSGGGWGWDNPLVAFGQIRQAWAPESVVAMLLMNDAHNTYWRTGWNWQGGFTYLPGNGGTLSAVAMMAAGTSTSPPCNFPAAWDAVCEDFLMPYP